MERPTDAGARGDLLAVEGLRVTFGSGRRRVEAVRGVDLVLNPGECLAIVGESGSGKSVTARALLGLAGPGSAVRADRLELDGEDLTRAGDRLWRRRRGDRIGLVLQDALSSLDPLRTVRAEIAETLRNHRVVPRPEVSGRVRELLVRVSVPEPDVRARQHPHELSGGLRQRALIASAIAGGPAVLVADEPTTALDVTVQAEILRLLAEMKAAGTAILLISHDLAVVAQMADRIAVMHGGEFVEQGAAADVLTAPAHPYTRCLLAAAPTARPPRARTPAPDRPARTVVEARGLTRGFRGPDGEHRPAVSDVSFTLSAGETLGIVGESGSGKTTVANLTLGLLEPEAGTVRLLGAPWSGVAERQRRPLRRRIQFVQQDPLASFDPRYTVERIIGEALGSAGRRTVRRRRDRITDLLHRVGLEPGLLDRYPRELSGGQRQRVAIARAIAPEPDVIVCDEPVSALDVSVQAQILDLFADLRDELGVALLFISHDLSVVRNVCDRVLVMRTAEVVEEGPVAQIFDAPRSPYTRALLDALPSLDRIGGKAVTTGLD